jgi:glycosyltransferase involved in cell wall biosynthesis
MTILYITQNGIADHIGQSQVAPYVIGLARKGFPIHVLSAEKAGQEEPITRYESAFQDAGVVRWTRVSYRQHPPILGQTCTQIDLERAARKIVGTGKVSLVHCRGFPPALIGYRLQKSFATPYIFDFRDFYADGGLDNTRGVRRALFRYFKHMEGPMLRDSNKIVCLTKKAREILTDWYFHDEPDPARRFCIIPCCADFDHFDPARVTSSARRAAQIRAGLPEGAFVLLYLGSLGPDYLLDEMIALFRQVLLRRPGARFLFVCNNGRELIESACRRQCVDVSSVHCVTADRNEVPAFITLADLSVIFIRSALAKAGCSPTKLAELLACNVPVIANSGVGDLQNLLAIDVNGSVAVDNLSDETLGNAIDQVIESRATRKIDIRSAGRVFGLEEGVRRYADIYAELLESNRRVKL